MRKKGDARYEQKRGWGYRIQELHAWGLVRVAKKGCLQFQCDFSFKCHSDDFSWLFMLSCVYHIISLKDNHLYNSLHLQSEKQFSMLIIHVCIYLYIYLDIYVCKHSLPPHFLSLTTQDPWNLKPKWRLWEPLRPQNRRIVREAQGMAIWMEPCGFPPKVREWLKWCPNKNESIFWASTLKQGKGELFFWMWDFCFLQNFWLGRWNGCKLRK